jgi:acylphosphatase
MAEAHGLAGWVRNCADGTVEAVFEGPRDAVEAAVDWCRTGPPRAEVASVSVEDEEPEALSQFRIT